MVVESLLDSDNISSSEQEIAQSSYEQFDDDALWHAIARNDIEALSYAYKRYYNGLYFYGLKCTSRSPLVEDSIQDLFLKLWDKRHNIQIKQAFKPYLFMMFRRIVIDKLNQLTKREEIKEAQDPLMPSLSVQDIIINREIEAEKLTRLDTALKGLSSRQKEIIYLRFYEELSYQQIADTLNIKYQSVRNYIYESIKLLKTAAKMIVLIIAALINWV